MVFRDNNTFVLQPTDYIIGPASGNPNLCLSWPKALPPSSDGVDWQLGMECVLRNFLLLMIHYRSAVLAYGVLCVEVSR